MSNDGLKESKRRVFSYAGVRLQKPRTINFTTQMFQLIRLHKNKTDIIWKFDGEAAKTLRE